MSKPNAKTNPANANAKPAEECFTIHPLNLHRMGMVGDEKKLAECEAKWEGVTVGEMCRRLWKEGEALADMMQGMRVRLWDAQLEAWKAGERNSAALSYFNAVDQSARCFVDQLEAMAAFGRECLCMESTRTAMPTVADESVSAKAKRKPWKVCGTHVEIEPCVLMVDDVREMLFALPDEVKTIFREMQKDAPEAKAASKPASASKTRGNTNTAPTSAKPSKGRRKGNASA